MLTLRFQADVALAGWGRARRLKACQTVAGGKHSAAPGRRRHAALDPEGVVHSVRRRLRGDQVCLTMPDASAAQRVADFFKRNREHLAPTSPPLPGDYFAIDYWRTRLEKNRAEFAADASCRMFVFPRDEPDGPILGTCDFTNIIRGPLQACNLGFALDVDAVGKGLMFDAVTAALAYAFEEMNLHRVMAGYLPKNERSSRLLRRLDFVVEGYARDYLFIGGAWRDQVLTAKTNPKPCMPRDDVGAAAPE